MKKKFLLMFCLMFGLVNLAVAGEPIGVFANSNTNCIQYIDPETQAVSNSLLKGSLGTYGGGLFDVVITSDGKTAIVSNFGDQTIFFIDISGGLGAEPTLSGEVKIPFFAEDMDLTPNSNRDEGCLLVTDGGFTDSVVTVKYKVVCKNGKCRYKSKVKVRSQRIMDESTPPVFSNAVDIAPDGQTVLTADYFGGKINLFTFNAENETLIHVQSKNVLPARPVNVIISPDGKTAIGVSASGFKVPVFALGTGTMDFKGFVTMPHKSGQSCVFSNDGTKAYYLSNSIFARAMIEVLDVTGPGQVTASGISITARPKRGTSQLFGVDTIAIEPSGNYLYVSNPTVSGGVTRISIIDLVSNTQVGYIQANGIPTGIAFATIE